MNPSNSLMIDDETPLNTKLNAKYKRSFAYYTVKERHPVILTKVIDHLSQDKNQIAEEYGEEAMDELKQIIGGFSKLKFELQTNKPFVPLISDSEESQIWNEYLNFRHEYDGSPPTWFLIDWLYEECYLYRRFREIFELSDILKNFDPFRKQKRYAFESSIDAMNMVTNSLELENLLHEEIEKHFNYLVKVNLWGNRCDLSLSCGNSVEVESPFKQIERLNKHILVDDTKEVWNELKTKNENKEDIIIDLICDNAGYELFTDLCLCDFLMRSKLVSQIRFHVKAMPWFVSDVTIPDFFWTIEELSKIEFKNTKELGERCLKYLENKNWTVEASSYWTLPFDFSLMEEKDPQLYIKLSEAKLIIFKGDLNYRKLVGDINWSKTTPFSTALRGFLPTSLVTLRTIKADVVVGLAEGQEEKLQDKANDWQITGDYAVINLATKKTRSP